jgi:hypothetical protein
MELLLHSVKRWRGIDVAGSGMARSRRVGPGLVRQGVSWRGRVIPINSFIGLIGLDEVR